MTNKVSFGDHVDIILGGTPDTSKVEFWNGEIPWASVVDFPDSKRIYSTQKTITQLGLEKSNTKLLNRGDIILSARGTVGKLVVCGRPMTFNQSCYALRTKDNKILDQDFLYYLTNTIVYQLQKLAVGGVFDTIIKSTIEKIHFTLKPISIQRKIASILSAYDDLIENNLKRIKLLEEAARLIYEEWFVRFRIDNLQLTIDNETGLPERWGKSKVGDLLGAYPKTQKINNTDFLKEGKYPIIDQSRDYIAGWTNEEKTLIDLPFPVIIFGDHTRILKIVNFPFARGADGTQIIVTNNPEKMPQGLFYWTLKNIDLSNYHYARHFKFLKEIEIVVPEKELAHKFETIHNNLLNQMKVLRQQNLLLTEARDILLPRLMYGTISIDN